MPGTESRRVRDRLLERNDLDGPDSDFMLRERIGRIERVTPGSTQWAAMSSATVSR